MALQFSGVSFLSKIFGQLPTPNYGLVGHRGAAGLVPENTLCGFIKAAALGLNWVEFDIQLCASGEWIVIHDETLERTTNGQGRIAETPYEVIKNLDAGSWFHPKFKNEHIPRLQEVLSCLADLKIHPNIEIKTFHKNKKQKMQSFLIQLQSAWPNSLPPPLISSFDLELLIILRSLAPDLPLGYLQDHLTHVSIQDTIENGFNSLHCHHNTFKTADFLYATQQGIPLLAYTVNEPHFIQMLLQAGITAVFSDMTCFAPN